jgi:hypothetical protein
MMAPRRAVSGRKDITCLLSSAQISSSDICHAADHHGQFKVQIERKYSEVL